ncbi:MAG TPA: hypothetical protein VMD99_00420 [Terriglobales bacterium]|nr:hypothetical protein [Terriglobales bacterium]
MWRRILAVVLLPTLTAAQSTQSGTVPAVQPQESRTTPGHAPVDHRPTYHQPVYQQYSRYDAVRRGRDEEIAIQISATGLVTTPKSPVAGIVPLSLELEPGDGITFGAVHYPKTQRRKVKFQSEPVPLAWWPEMRFKIRADRNATLGAHVLRGKITVQVIPYDLSAPRPVQQMDIQIPVTVVEHDARVRR